MVQLVKIGNSQGIRIPKALVEQAQLTGHELKLKLVDNGLLITPEKDSRKGWQKEIEETIAAQGREVLDDVWLGLPLDSDEELEW
mgnify:FL=1